MPIRDYKLFIFDWDGTLSTSTFLVRASKLLHRRYNQSYVNAHAKNYGADSIDGVRVDKRTNMLYSFLYDAYSTIAKPRLKEKAIDILKLLKSKGKKIAIFSDSEEYRLLKEIKETGVAGYIDFFLSASAVGYYKPNPTGLLVILDKYRIGKRDSVYIGDMVSDVVTARFGRIASCVVGDGFEPYGLLKTSKPDYLFKDLESLLNEMTVR